MPDTSGQPSAWEPSWSQYRAVAAEGARIGLITCLECGAAVVIDPADQRPATDLHEDWHRTNDKSGLSANDLSEASMGYPDGADT